MNKRELQRYLNRGCKKKEGLNRCIIYDNKYLISDGFSVIALNNNPGVDISESLYGLERIYDDFIKLEPECEVLYKKGEQYLIINEDYAVSSFLINNINTIIKGDRYIVVRQSINTTPILKIVNSKTGEYAFILPVKVY